MRYEYRLVKETATHPDIGEFETAGIELVEIGETVRRVDYQADISPQAENVQMLVELMNRTYTSPSMFHKVVEDIFFS